MITREEHEAFGLRPLTTIAKKIREVCRLDFFSTEIAVTRDNRFVVVDYVNDICDMRVQSQHYDGVPDQVLLDICRRFARYLKSIRVEGMLAVNA